MSGHPIAGSGSAGRARLAANYDQTLMQPEPRGRAGRRLLRMTHQNAFLLVLSLAAVWGGLAYPKLRIELWLPGGLLLVLALVNLIRVVRLNRASSGDPPRD